LRGGAQTRHAERSPITDAELAAVNLTGDAFHPEWNYTITPSVKKT
jgi:hypothetical protein